MTDAELSKRLRRVRAALGDVSGVRPEDAPPPTVRGVGKDFHLVQDYSADRTLEQLEKDAYGVINEIMGIKGRARAWMKGRGKDSELVGPFLKTHRHAAIVHDLANADKHGTSGRTTVSGLQPILKEVHKGVVLVRNPVTGKYASEGSVTRQVNILTGEVQNMPIENTELVLTGKIVDSSDTEILALHDLFFWAIKDWEEFLNGQGVVLS